jgi:hypothetical protein
MADEAVHENKKRFATVDEEELRKILKEKDAVNTRRATYVSIKA